MSYQREFGDMFDLGFDLTELNFLTDRSWKQDVSPSFYFNIGCHYFVLWIDYKYPEQREESNDRYLVQQATNIGSFLEPETCADGEQIFSCESHDEIKGFLQLMITKTPNALSYKV